VSLPMNMWLSFSDLCIAAGSLPHQWNAVWGPAVGLRKPGLPQISSGKYCLPCGVLDVECWVGCFLSLGSQLATDWSPLSVSRLQLLSARNRVDFPLRERHCHLAWQVYWLWAFHSSDVCFAFGRVLPLFNVALQHVRPCLDDYSRGWLASPQCLLSISGVHLGLTGGETSKPLEGKISKRQNIQLPVYGPFPHIVMIDIVCLLHTHRYSFFSQ